jgi:RNA polymerase sigma-70 factor (ECF subfamily)
MDFEAVLSGYKDYVYNLAYRMLRSREEAQDAAQDAFLKVYLNLHRYDPGRDLKAWLCAVTLNACRDLYRRRRGMRRAEESELLALSDDGHGGRIADQKLMAESVLKALPFEFRSVIVLFYLEDKTVKEISRILGIPQVLVKVRLHRARKRAKELM